MMSALHWALFVERIWPESAGEIDRPLSANEPPEARVAHYNAQESLGILRGVLYPED